MGTNSKNSKSGASPRATGPAGSQFEVKVAAHYSLSVLAQTEAFGLPGAVVRRLEFQRADQGHPLDDIILHGEAADGSTRCLEVQAKRQMAFTESDANFDAVARMLVDGWRIDPQRRFAVAIERTSSSIDRGVQEVLELSRHTIDDKSFEAQLAAPGRNRQMRDFYAAFKAKLAANGVTDTADVFAVLRNFSVLVFDYARPNSIAEHTDRMRASRIAGGNEGLYDALVSELLAADAIGGEGDRRHWAEKLRERGILLNEVRTFALARKRIAEMASFALQDIDIRIAGVQIARSEMRFQLEGLIDDAMLSSGIVEIVGEGGTGKSALLRAAADARSTLARTIVLSPDRTPPGGWAALRAQYDIDVSAEDFLLDLACDGGGVIFIDGLDKFRDQGERNTIMDLVIAASSVSGVCVVFTARTGWADANAFNFSDTFTDTLGDRKTLTIETLNDQEAEALAESCPALSELLKPDHPAKHLARNPFILRRIAEARLQAEAIISEAALAANWWGTGGHGFSQSQGQQRARKRTIIATVEAQLSGLSLADVKKEDHDAVSSLIEDGVLVEIAADRVKFRHDIFTDWAVGMYLSELSEHWGDLNLSAAPAYWLSRGVELCFRRLAENPQSGWHDAMTSLVRDSAHEGWVALGLLALARSELAIELLQRHSDYLVDGDGVLAERLLRRVIAAHSQPAEKVLAELTPQATSVPVGLIIPKGPVWIPVLVWTTRSFGRLPARALAAAVDVFEAWLILAAFGENTLSPALIDRLTDLLVADIEQADMPMPKPGDALPEIRYPANGDTRESARLSVALHADKNPAAASRYLNAIVNSNRSSSYFSEILRFPGNLPSVAPIEFCQAFRCAVDDEMQSQSRFSSRRDYPPSLMQIEHPFSLGKTGIGLFQSLFKANPDTALSLLRHLIRSLEQPGPQSYSIDLMLAGVAKEVSPVSSYAWSRGHGPSRLVSKALCALEDWAHGVLDNSGNLTELIEKIADDRPLSGALLLTIVDLVLCHAKLDSPLLHDLLASPELLALDGQRLQHDQLDHLQGGGNFRWDRGPATDRLVTEALACKASRSISLHNVIPQIVFRQPEFAVEDLRRRIEEAVDRLGTWTKPEVDWAAPEYMASHALRMTHRENYRKVSETGDDGELVEGYIYEFPPEQQSWLDQQSEATSAQHRAFTASLAMRMSMDKEDSDLRVPVGDALQLLLDGGDTTAPKEAVDFEPDDPWIARVGAAAFLARYLSDDQLPQHATILSSVFDQALAVAARSRTNLRFDIMYDPTALALCGRLYLVNRAAPGENVSQLLTLTGLHPSAAASVFSRHPEATKALGENTVCALVRVGIDACIFARRANLDEHASAYEARCSARKHAIAARLDSENGWLAGEGDLPAWPSPPVEAPRPKRQGIVIGAKNQTRKPRQVTPSWPDFYFDHHTAEVWLRVFATVATIDTTADFLTSNLAWMTQSLAGADDETEPRDTANAWAKALFEFAAPVAKDWSEQHLERLIFAPLSSLPDETFLGTAAAFLTGSDLRLVAGDTSHTAYLAYIRKRLWQRLQTTRHWKQHQWSSRGSLEIHLNDLISPFFLKAVQGFGDRVSYTKGLSEDQILPFLPVLSDISVSAGACPTIANMLLDLLELVQPGNAAPHLYAASMRWRESGREEFWRTANIGHRTSEIAMKSDTACLATKGWSDIADSIAAAGVPAGEALKQAVVEIEKRAASGG